MCPGMQSYTVFSSVIVSSGQFRPEIKEIFIGYFKKQFILSQYFAEKLEFIQRLQAENI